MVDFTGEIFLAFLVAGAFDGDFTADAWLPSLSMLSFAFSTGTEVGYYSRHGRKKIDCLSEFSTSK